MRPSRSTGALFESGRRRLRAAFPESLRGWIRARQRRHGLVWPARGHVDFGGLRRRRPISRVYGSERGLGIERYYIERFLEGQRERIRGRVLEIGDDRYTRRFGGSGVTRSDVLHVVEGNPGATIVADLTRADGIPAASFDCILLTQTLQMIYEVRPALRHLHRILAPGGALLLTSAGISRVARWEGVDPWGEYWHFTVQSLRRLLAEIFQEGRVEVGSRGNVLAAVAALHGLAAEELRRDELEFLDPDYGVVITAVAVKAA